MRFVLLAAFAFAATLSGAAHASAPNAQALYVERRALLEADAQCHLFSPDMRAALQAGAGQAAGALLRGGWTRPRLNELEQAAVGAARARRCGDPRTADAARTAEAGFASWIRTFSMTFPGAARTWRARRAPDPNGWRLLQQIDAPIAATFGVRGSGDAQQLTLSIPLTGGAAAPGSVQLWLRDPARADAALLDLPGRTATGLAAGAPSAHAATRFFANARRIETPPHQPAQAVFTFPAQAFAALLALDPREAAELRLESGGRTQRLLIEVGDLAAARAFLTIGQ